MIRPDLDYYRKFSGRKKKKRKCKHAVPKWEWACETCERGYHTHNCFARYKYKTLKHTNKFESWYGLDNIQTELKEFYNYGYYD